MFRSINYRTETRFEPIPIVRIKPENKKYEEWDVIVGKSVLNVKEKNSDESKSILELMKDMKRTNKSI